MMLIHTALLCEARPLIEHYRLKKVDGFYINKNLNTALIISGIGKKNTKNALLQAFGKFDIKFALNLGVCGCKDKSIKIGSLFCTNKKLDGFKFESIQSVKDPKQPINTTLCDMESEEFIKVCDEKNIPNLVLKVVSDYQDIDRLDKNFVYNLIKTNIKDILLAINSEFK